MATANQQLEQPVPQPASPTPRITDAELEMLLREAFKSAIEQGEVSREFRKNRQES